METKRESSRKALTSLGTEEDIRTGCLQRIADGVEKMTEGWIRLTESRELYKKWYEEERLCAAKMSRRIIALQGVITRLKNQQVRSTETPHEVPETAAKPQ